MFLILENLTIQTFVGEFPRNSLNVYASQIKYFLFVMKRLCLKDFL